MLSSKSFWQGLEGPTETQPMERAKRVNDRHMLPAQRVGPRFSNECNDAEVVLMPKSNSVLASICQIACGPKWGTACVIESLSRQIEFDYENTFSLLRILEIMNRQTETSIFIRKARRMGPLGPTWRLEAAEMGNMRGNARPSLSGKNNDMLQGKRGDAREIPQN